MTNPQTENWVSVKDRLPDVKLGTEMLCWVCAVRPHGPFVYECYYVNRPAPKGEEDYHWAIYEEGDGDPLDCVGWFDIGCNSVYDEFFMPTQSPNEIVAWQEIKKPAPPRSHE